MSRSDLQAAVEAALAPLVGSRVVVGVCDVPNVPATVVGFLLSPQSGLLNIDVRIDGGESMTVTLDELT